MVKNVYCFAYVEPALLSWDETNLVMVYDFSQYVFECAWLVFYLEFLRLCSLMILVCNFLSLRYHYLALVANHKKRRDICFH